MIKLNRTTEYGLMALRHISRKHLIDPKLVTSAREVADSYQLPFEITAKTLQKLKEVGLIQSAHGARGGYTLQRSLQDVSLAEFLELMEGPQSLVVCAAGTDDSSIPHKGGNCEYGHRCEIKQMMASLNARVVQFLSSIRLAEFTAELATEMTSQNASVSHVSTVSLKAEDSLCSMNQNQQQEIFKQEVIK